MLPLIPKDKLLHLAMGVSAVVVTLLAFWLSQWRLGAPLALMSTALGVFYELQQWYRKEGQPGVYDAVATALPGWVAWGALELVL